LMHENPDYNFEFIQKEKWWKNIPDDRDNNEIQVFDRENNQELMSRI
jgi:hypothetical protein